MNACHRHLRRHAIVPVVACLCACTAPPRGSPGDAVRCDAPDAGASVYVEIGYGTDGVPFATPDECTVAPGARVEWRGPDGQSRPFLIRFTARSPVPRAPRGELPSQASGKRQVASGVLERTPGRYPYVVRAGLQERDPAIIIR